MALRELDRTPTLLISWADFSRCWNPPQYAALGRVNAPIRDSVLRLGFGDAGACVRSADLRGLRHHVADAMKQGRGGWIEGRSARSWRTLPPELPRTLRLEDQGRFAIGYYHERAFRRPRADEIDPSEEETSR